MNSTVLALRTAAVVSLFAVAACDKPKPRDVAAAPEAPPAATAAPPAAPLPALPAWASDYVGKPFTTAFAAGRAKCLGNTDSVMDRFGTEGVRVVGWGWDPAKKAAVSRVILVDRDAVVVGAGESGMARPDVTAADGAITDPNTGWSALTSKTAGPVDAYGLVGDGKTLCPLGHLEF